MNCVMCQRAILRPFSRVTTPQVCVCKMEHYQCLECDESMACHCGFCGGTTHLLSVKLHLELAMSPRTTSPTSQPIKKGKIVLFQNDNPANLSVDSKKNRGNYVLEKKRDLLERKRSLSEVAERKDVGVMTRSRSSSVANEKTICTKSQREANAKSANPTEESEPTSQNFMVPKDPRNSERDGNLSGVSLSVSLKKASKQVNPALLKLEPEKKEVGTETERGKIVLPVKYDVLGRPHIYSLSLLGSNPLNANPNALCNLISMVRRVVYTGRTWQAWHSSIVSCPTVYFDKLMKLRKGVMSVQLPIAMEDMLKNFNVAKCPEFNCSSSIFLEELNDHLVNCHRFWTISKIRLGQPKIFSLDLRLTLRNVPKCHAVMLLKNVVTGFGKDVVKDLLPIMVMSMHIKLGDITADPNSEEELTVVWATTVNSELLPLRITLTMWSLEGDRPECIVSYTGQPYDLRTSRRPLKVLKSGRVIILTSDQVAGLTQNGNEMVGFQISAKMDVSPMLTEDAPEDTETQDGSDDESSDGNLKN
ncbi:uncharacterized protein [Drosophila bipectinata]|uniref:uncharacterized protein n=1 Tax=Drosophila bipectinata TaxID=42026 RepID=UPI001C8990ED|nr:uncharacterized protein LOC108134045 [Drosophila bipectinata]